MALLFKITQYDNGPVHITGSAADLVEIARAALTAVQAAAATPYPALSSEITAHIPTEDGIKEVTFICEHPRTVD